MRHWTIVLAGLAAVAVAGSAMAVTVYDLPDLSKTGVLRASTTWSPPGGWPTDRARCGFLEGGLRTSFGAEFAGPTTVTSLTIEQPPGIGVIKTLRVYADGVWVGTLSLPNDVSRQTYEFADYLKDLSGQPLSSVPATWGLVLVGDMSWSWSGGTLGLTYYAFNGTPYVGESVNPNLHTTGGVVSGFDAKNVYRSGTYPLNPNAGADVTNGILNNSFDPRTCWMRNDFPESATAGTEQSFTVFYNDPQTVASIGLAFMDDGVSTRGSPNWVTISGSQEGQEVRIDLDAVLRQYNRYDLTDGDGNPVIFEDTEWLKITLPPPDSANYVAADNIVSLLEFQAFQFATSYIPEPATMSLLALGGLAMLRRVRR